MSIENDTSIIPAIIADTMLNELIKYLADQCKCNKCIKCKCVSCILNKQKNRLIDFLAHTAETIYSNNPDWARLLRRRGNIGRDTLNKFMQHWLTAELNILGFIQILPPGFAEGRIIPKNF